MSKAARLVTAEELERFRSDDNRYELVAGRVVRMTPVTLQHGRLVVRIGALLDAHIRHHRLPAFVGTEVGFKLASNPDTVRAPDVAVVGSNRVASPDAAGFFNGAPDLAIEVLSSDDRQGEVQEKVDEYLARGVPLVIVVHPRDETVAVFRPAVPPVTLRHDEVLDLGDVVPGFTCRVRDVFS